jgi:hypothetical protein
MTREIARLSAEVQRLRQVERDYTKLLRRSNQHSAVMARNVLEAIIRPPVNYAESIEYVWNRKEVVET